MAKIKSKTLLIIIGAFGILLLFFIFVPTNRIEGVVDVESMATPKVYIVSGYLFFNDVMRMAYTYSTAQHKYATEATLVRMGRKDSVDPTVKETRDSLLIQFSLVLKNNSSVEEILPDRNGNYSISTSLGNRFVFVLADFQILGLESKYLIGFQTMRCDITNRL